MDKLCDNENSVLAYIRKGNDAKNDLVIVANLTPMVHENYRIGIPNNLKLKEIFNSDDSNYNGSNQLNKKLIKTDQIAWNGKPFSAEIKLAPLAIAVFQLKQKNLRICG